MIYLDNAATTQTDPRVVAAMLPYFTEKYGNPSSQYEFGRTNKEVIRKVQNKVADYVHCSPDEVYFTSGSTESNNWILKGMADKHPGGHMIVSAIQHDSILMTCAFLEEHGIEVTYLPVNEKGLVDPNDVRNAIKDNTFLVSVMTANSEIGTIQPIKAIGMICANRGVPFHTDATQAFGAVEINMADDDISLLSASGHKFGAARGIGIAVIRKNIEISPLLHGWQFGKMRGGTENVPGIVSIGKAIDILGEARDRNYVVEKSLRDQLANDISTHISSVKLNGDFENRLPNNVNCSFQGINGEELQALLAMHDILVSTGSACCSASGEPSHVLLAIGDTTDEANSAIRFTIGPNTTPDEIDEVVDVLTHCVRQLRNK